MSFQVVLLKSPVLPAPPFEELDVDSCPPFGAMADVQQQLSACLPELTWGAGAGTVADLGKALMEIWLESGPGSEDPPASSDSLVRCITLLLPNSHVKKALPTIRQLCQALGALAVDCQNGEYLN